MREHATEAGASPVAGSGELSAEPEVRAIAEALEKWHSQLGRQFGPLSRPQRRTLRLLASVPSMRVSDLAEQLGLTSAGATRMLDTLEVQGLATRARLPRADQREVYVSLTEAGGWALAQADAVYFERVSTGVQRLSLEERHTLAKLLQGLLE
jgi:DNA-binding MarR family transcriptional regulator